MATKNEILKELFTLSDKALFTMPRFPERFTVSEVKKMRKDQILEILAYEKAEKTAEEVINNLAEELLTLEKASKTIDGESDSFDDVPEGHVLLKIKHSNTTTSEYHQFVHADDVVKHQRMSEINTLLAYVNRAFAVDRFVVRVADHGKFDYLSTSRIYQGI